MTMTNLCPWWILKFYEYIIRLSDLLCVCVQSIIVTSKHELFIHQLIKFQKHFVNLMDLLILLVNWMKPVFCKTSKCRIDKHNGFLTCGMLSPVSFTHKFRILPNVWSIQNRTILVYFGGESSNCKNQLQENENKQEKAKPAEGELKQQETAVSDENSSKFGIEKGASLSVSVSGEAEVTHLSDDTNCKSRKRKRNSTNSEWKNSSEANEDDEVIYQPNAELGHPPNPPLSLYMDIESRPSINHVVCCADKEKCNRIWEKKKSDYCEKSDKLVTSNECQVRSKKVKKYQNHQKSSKKLNNNKSKIDSSERISRKSGNEVKYIVDTGDLADDSEGCSDELERSKQLRISEEYLDQSEDSEKTVKRLNDNRKPENLLEGSGEYSVSSGDNRESNDNGFYKTSEKSGDVKENNQSFGSHFEDNQESRNQLNEIEESENKLHESRESEVQPSKSEEFIDYLSESEESSCKRDFENMLGNIAKSERSGYIRESESRSEDSGGSGDSGELGDRSGDSEESEDSWEWNTRVQFGGQVNDNENCHDEEAECKSGDRFCVMNGIRLDGSKINCQCEDSKKSEKQSNINKKIEVISNSNKRSENFSRVCKKCDSKLCVNFPTSVIGECSKTGKEMDKNGKKSSIIDASEFAGNLTTQIKAPFTESSENEDQRNISKRKNSASSYHSKSDIACKDHEIVEPSTKLPSKSSAIINLFDNYMSKENNQRHDIDSCPLINCAIDVQLRNARSSVEVVGPQNVETECLPGLLMGSSAISDAASSKPFSDSTSAETHFSNPGCAIVSGGIKIPTQTFQSHSTNKQKNLAILIQNFFLRNSTLMRKRKYDVILKEKLVIFAASTGLELDQNFRLVLPQEYSEKIFANSHLPAAARVSLENGEPVDVNSDSSDVDFFDYGEFGDRDGMSHLAFPLPIPDDSNHFQEIPEFSSAYIPMDPAISILNTIIRMRPLFYMHEEMNVHYPDHAEFGRLEGDTSDFDDELQYGSKVNGYPMIYILDYAGNMDTEGALFRLLITPKQIIWQGRDEVHINVEHWACFRGDSCDRQSNFQDINEFNDRLIVVSISRRMYQSVRNWSFIRTEHDNWLSAASFSTESEQEEEVNAGDRIEHFPARCHNDVCAEYAMRKKLLGLSQKDIAGRSLTFDSDSFPNTSTKNMNDPLQLHPCSGRNIQFALTSNESKIPFYITFSSDGIMSLNVYSRFRQSKSCKNKKPDISTIPVFTLAADWKNQTVKVYESFPNQQNQEARNSKETDELPAEEIAEEPINLCTKNLNHRGSLKLNPFETNKANMSETSGTRKKEPKTKDKRCLCSESSDNENMSNNISNNKRQIKDSMNKFRKLFSVSKEMNGINKDRTSAACSHENPLSTSKESFHFMENHKASASSNKTAASTSETPTSPSIKCSSTLSTGKLKHESTTSIHVASCSRGTSNNVEGKTSNSLNEKTTVSSRIFTCSNEIASTSNERPDTAACLHQERENDWTNISGSSLEDYPRKTRGFVTVFTDGESTLFAFSEYSFSIQPEFAVLINNNLSEIKLYFKSALNFKYQIPRNVYLSLAEHRVEIEQPSLSHFHDSICYNVVHHQTSTSAVSNAFNCSHYSDIMGASIYCEHYEARLVRFVNANNEHTGYSYLTKNMHAPVSQSTSAYASTSENSTSPKIDSTKKLLLNRSSSMNLPIQEKERKKCLPPTPRKKTKLENDKENCPYEFENNRPLYDSVGESSQYPGAMPSIVKKLSASSMNIAEGETSRSGIIKDNSLDNALKYVTADEQDLHFHGPITNSTSVSYMTRNRNPIISFDFLATRFYESRISKILTKYPNTVHLTL